MRDASPLRPRALPEFADVRSLADPRRGPLVSLYLPLLRGFPHVRQNAAAYQGAVAEAELRLQAAGLSPGEAAASGEQLAAVETDLRRFERRAAGVAVFRDRATLHAYGLQQEPARCVMVADNFALRPLLAAVHRDRRYHVLALSTNRVALFKGDAFGLATILAQGVPASLEDALGTELTAKELRVSGTQAGAASPRYFSHDSGRDERKLDLKRFHLRIARAIEAELVGCDEPLILVAAQAHHSGLRAALRLPCLLPTGVETSPDHLSTSDLHARTWPLVDDASDAEDAALASEYEGFVARGKGLHRISDVAAASAAGRVHRLWVTRDERLPGAIDPASGVLVGGRPEEDVLDGIVSLVLRHGGDVIVSRCVPSGSSVAAELR